MTIKNKIRLPKKCKILINFRKIQKYFRRVPSKKTIQQEKKKSFHSLIRTNKNFIYKKKKKQKKRR